MKLKSIYCLILLFISGVIFSQEIPVIKIGEEKINIKKLGITTEVVGDIAVTTFDMQFYNPNDRVLEGELSFPLGENQSVTRFALDINGNLRDAVVVEKEKARVAFETTVRNKIDPALLEQTKGNNYKARIYPIPAKGYKRVVLAFQQKLTIHNNSYYYKLPFNYKYRLDEFSFDIQVLNQKNKPVSQNGMLSSFEYNSEENTYYAKINKKKEKVTKPVTIKIPLNTKKEKLLTGGNYFYFTKKLAIEKRKVSLANKITVFWDVSLSQKSKRITSELDLLDMYFKQVQNCKVNLVFFNTEVTSQTKFTVKKGNWNLLKEKIENAIYDGASSFDFLSAYKDSSKANLLFTDGLNTLSDIGEVPMSKTYIINSASSANHIQLKNIAHKTGGAYLNLNQTSVAKAFFKFTEEGLQFLGTNFSEDDVEVYPKKGSFISEGFSISGKGDFLNKKIVLKFGYGNKVLNMVSFKLKKEHVKNDIVRGIWAQKKLTHLLNDKKKNEVVIVKLSKEHQIISPFTSMLILDRVEDYVTHKITPPKELQEEYRELIAQQIDDKKERLKRLQENLFDSYTSFFKWYDTDFNVSEEDLKSNTRRNRLRTSTTTEVTTNNRLSEEGVFVVSGTIKDSTAEIAGVSVIVKGTARGTESDFDGKYSISVKVGDILEYSFVGLKSIEKTITNTNNINVLLADESNTLDEVVVVGYGTTRRISTTANSVKSVLAGSVSGVTVQSHEDIEEEVVEMREVDESVSLNKKEVASSSNNNNNVNDLGKLYVVDGVVVNGNPNFKPEDIESMEILKSAASTAIFGSRGGDGVVVITTKKGVKDNLQTITDFKNLVKEKIELKGWNPDTPYLQQLKEAVTIKQAYVKYLELRKEYGTSPSFYIDVADFFKDKGAEKKAVQILTNVAEIDLDNYELLKALAYKFEEYKLYDFAVYVYKEVLKLRPEDIQSYRDLALVYEDVREYQKSIDLLYQIINGEFLAKDESRRFSGVEIIALNEFNRMLRLYSYSSKIKTKHFDEQFIKDTSTDFRVVIDWNHNDTDIDLWVIDPNEEKCFYSHKKTKIGGLMSDDMTQGFGPEQFVLKNVLKGVYDIKVKYYSNSQQKVSGPTFLKITIYKNYGARNEEKITKLIRLKEANQVLDVAKVSF